MPKTSFTVPVFRPAMPRWVVVGAAGGGGCLLSLVCSYNDVSPLWAIPVSLALAYYTATVWARRKYEDVTAKPCPGCGKVPSMLLETDDDAIHIRVWCSGRPKCRTTGGLEVRATINTEADVERADVLRLACQRAADGWSADDMQELLRQQARN